MPSSICYSGPIPEMIDEAELYILSAMRKASLIDGIQRKDVPEYPQEALREALANAIAHRDYSSYVRGSYIQVRMFADRLEVQSPGGLFGNVNEENLEEEHSTRNARLMRMMEDLHIVENRGSGIKSMLQSMREANLEPPAFKDRRSSFVLTFRNHTLMSPAAITWLNQFSEVPLEDRQRLSLVYLRQRDRMTNSDYRRLNHVDPLTAGNELRGLVQTELIIQHGIGRGTYYTLIESLMDEEMVKEGPFLSDEEKILNFVRRHGSISNPQCREFLDVEFNQASYLLKRLARNGHLKREGLNRWTVYKLP